MKLSALIRAMRPKHWVKNLLIFVPTLAAHKLPNSETQFHLLIAFVSLSLVASSMYLLNDISDIESDRQHPKKKHRPIAAGEISTNLGWTAAIAMLLTAVALSYIGKPVSLDGCCSMHFRRLLIQHFSNASLSSIVLP